jgi:nicotinamidase-related amidase
MADPSREIDAKHAALLVMDCQPAILGSLEDDEPLLAHITDAIGVVRDRGGHVGHVRVAFEDDDYDAIPSHSRMAQAVAAVGRKLHVNSPGTDFDGRATPEPGDIVVRKTRVGAFSTTDLASQLSDRGVTTLLLAGLHTSGVVLSTVRDAHDRDYRVIVLRDATADPQTDVHSFLTDMIFPRQAEVISVSELEGLLATAGQG